MNNRIRLGIFILLVCLLLGLTSSKITDKFPFTEEEMEEIRGEADKRVAAFKKKKQEECREKLMEEVEAKVDTMLMYDVRQLLMGDDTTQIPSPPPRPDAPEVLKPEDDTPLSPLVDENELSE